MSEIIEIKGVKYRRITPDNRAKVTVRLPVDLADALNTMALSRGKSKSRIVELALYSFAASQQILKR